MSLNQRMKGLSLKVGPLGENDRLLTILSEENGISRFAIPGARKPKSRLGATSPFNFLDLHIVGTKNQTKQVNEIVKNRISIKAVGGIKTFDQALEIIKAGSTYIGTSFGFEIIQGQHREGQ